MGYTNKQALAFIDGIAPVIVAEANRRGYKIKSTVIAQAIVEGAAGTSKLAKNYHNHFGMKCGSKWKGKSVNLSTKEEYTAGTLTNIKANFRVYDTDAEGIAGYYDFIDSSRYANLKNAKDYTEYAKMLKADGWATSSTYVNTLVNTVNRYGLAKYDGGGSVSPVISLPVLKRGAKGDAVKKLQEVLIKAGYGKYVGAADGIFGIKTENAVREFQLDHIDKCKISDGIVGAKTWSALGVK